MEKLNTWLLERYVALTAPGAREEEGQTLAEYALILALIAVVCVVAVTFLGTRISSILSYVGTQI